jgi:predicted enzyme related to lactoylglutathione lyase
MPTRDTAPLGAPCWIELFTSDTERATAFYGELFGWEADAPREEFGGYININKDGERIAGCMRNDGSSGAPDSWSVYLAVEDARANAAAVAANGGQVLVEPMEVMDLGTMAVYLDAGGAAVGAWQPGTHKGFGLLAEAGAPAWFELHTQAYQPSVDFYRQAFGWDTHTMSDTPEFRYTTLGEGEGQLAGIMDDTVGGVEPGPAHWAIYFGVGDTDAAVAKVVELGGAVVTPPTDSPYGRLAEVADPGGVRFRLVADS